MALEVDENFKRIWHRLDANLVVNEAFNDRNAPISYKQTWPNLILDTSIRLMEITTELLKAYGDESLQSDLASAKLKIGWIQYQDSRI